MARYRIKTKKEFGGKAPRGWNSRGSMDFLYGLETNFAKLEDSVKIYRTNLADPSKWGSSTAVWVVHREDFVEITGDSQVLTLEEEDKYPVLCQEE